MHPNSHTHACSLSRCPCTPQPVTQNRMAEHTMPDDMLAHTRCIPETLSNWQLHSASDILGSHTLMRTSTQGQRRDAAVKVRTTGPRWTTLSPGIPTAATRSRFLRSVGPSHRAEQTQLRRQWNPAYNNDGCVRAPLNPRSHNNLACANLQVLIPQTYSEAAGSSASWLCKVAHPSQCHIWIDQHKGLSRRSPCPASFHQQAGAESSPAAAVNEFHSEVLLQDAGRYVAILVLDAARRKAYENTMMIYLRSRRHPGTHGRCANA